MQTCKTVGCKRSYIGSDGYCFQHTQRMPVFKVSLKGGSHYFASVADIAGSLEGDCDGAEAGTKWEIELVYMSKRQYKELPDFEGH